MSCKYCNSPDWTPRYLAKNHSWQHLRIAFPTEIKTVACADQSTRMHISEVGHFPMDSTNNYDPTSDLQPASELEFLKDLLSEIEGIAYDQCSEDADPQINADEALVLIWEKSRSAWGRETPAKGRGDKFKEYRCPRCEAIWSFRWEISEDSLEEKRSSAPPRYCPQCGVLAEAVSDGR